MNDTICAVSTPPGVGGIAVIRLSGPQTIEIFAPLWKGKPLDALQPRTAHLGSIIDPATGELLDRPLITIFRAPASYTGEDTIEISVHGSTWIQSEILKLLMRQGARLAEPGEFTRRAFTAGNLDLVQAEAVADLIAARSKAAHRIATSQIKGTFSRRLDSLRQQMLHLASLLELELDFSDQDVEFASRTEIIRIAQEIIEEIRRLSKSFDRGQAIAEGIPIAIVGDTNAGKSTLLNTLVEHDRAIVSEHRGTTRDTIEETTTIGELLFRFIDTAGIRNTDDPVEAMGIERSLQAIQKAPIILWVIDSTSSQSDVDEAYHRIFDTIPKNTLEGKKVIAALNKQDISNNLPPIQLAKYQLDNVLHISAATGDGTENLKKIITKATGITKDENDITITNIRHYQALENAASALQSLNDSLPTVILAQTIRISMNYLGEITGEITNNDILSNIFSRFCIGK